MKKAAGYIRVSTKGQTKNESLEGQSESIKKYVQLHHHKLVKIYADKGISGATVEARLGLRQCLEDAQDGKFEVLIIYSLSRFGRNATEILQNYDLIKDFGIQLVSIKEGIDFSTTYGKAMYGMFGVMAELEKEMIKERMLGGRIAKAKKGIPTVGSKPFGRTFNRETGKWILDENKAELIRWAAGEYIKGVSLNDIVDVLRTEHDLKIGYDSLKHTLKHGGGTEWSIQFKGEEPIPYKIPRILDDHIIQQVRDRLEFNRVNNRTDVRNKYVLTGFIRCEKCLKTIHGVTIKGPYGTNVYYKHDYGKSHKDCTPPPFTFINAANIERAVFETIFENIVDVPKFEAAIAESLPDADTIKKLELEIKQKEKNRSRIQKEILELLDHPLKGTFRGEIEAKGIKLSNTREKITDDIIKLKRELDNMPDPVKVKKEADQIRRALMDKYSGLQRLANMTYQDKKDLLHWLFDGKAPNGDPYGIYVTKRGRWSKAKIDYFLFGRITGLRTMKGDDINYQKWDEDEPESNNNYNTKNPVFDQPLRSYNLEFKVKSPQWPANSV